MTMTMIDGGKDVRARWQSRQLMRMKTKMRLMLELMERRDKKQVFLWLIIKRRT